MQGYPKVGKHQQSSDRFNNGETVRKKPEHLYRSARQEESPAINI